MKEQKEQKEQYNNNWSEWDTLKTTHPSIMNNLMSDNYGTYETEDNISIHPHQIQKHTIDKAVLISSIKDSVMEANSLGTPIEINGHKVLKLDVLLSNIGIDESELELK